MARSRVDQALAAAELSRIADRVGHDPNVQGQAWTSGAGGFPTEEP